MHAVSADPDDPHEVWQNDEYAAVLRTRSDGLPSITVSRHDREPFPDAKHLRSIKNEILGAEREGCELFPAESRLMDSSIERHLWFFRRARSSTSVSPDGM